jgi:hypothetical protein
MLGSLKFQVRREPKSYQDGDDRFAEVADASITARRPDLHVASAATAQSVLIDVTVCAGTNNRAVRSAFRRPQAALTAAATAKHRVYASAPNTTDVAGEFVAFAVSSTGTLGQEGRNWLQRTIKPVLGTFDRVKARRWKHFWLSVLSEACADGLAQQLVAQTAGLEASAARSGVADHGRQEDGNGWAGL